MKLIFITREGFNSPGARVRCYNFAKELRNYNFQTEIISLKDTFGAKDGKEEPTLTVSEKIKYNYKTFCKLLKYKNAILYLNRLNYHSFAPLLFELIYRNKLILDIDDWEIREDNKHYLSFFPASKAQILTQITAKKSNLCLAGSIYLLNFLKQFNSSTYYIPSAVDDSLFTPPSKKINKSDLIFSWMGTVHKKSNIYDLKFIIECFSGLQKKYSGISLEILAEGIYSKQLKNLIEQFRNKNITLKNWLPPDKIPNYLAKIDIGLVPLTKKSKFNQSKSPLKLFEYMAVGAATVSSNIGEIKQIINNGFNGLTADSKEEFTTKMEALINNKSLREKISQNARQTIEDKYSLRIIGKKLAEIISQL